MLTMATPLKERAEWVNSILTSMWPHLGEYVDSMLKKEVEPQVRQVLDAKGLGGFKFNKIYFGKIAPKITAIEVKHDPNSKQSEIMQKDVESIPRCTILPGMTKS